MTATFSSKKARLFSSFSVWFKTSKVERHPLTFMIMLLMLVLFFLPYTIPGNTYESLGAYGALAVIPVTVASFLWERKGGFISTLLVICGLACVNCFDIGLHWPFSLTRTWLLGGVALLFFGMVTGQLCHTGRQLKAAHAKSKQAEVELARAYEQQVELNTLKDQFLFNVSHELRAPLTQVYGYLQLLEAYHETLTSEKRAAFITQTTQGCEELLLLITNLLDAAHVEQDMRPPQPEELVLLHCVHELLDQFDPQQREDHPVHLDIAEDLLVYADPQHVRQILRNLLSNAFKYAPLHAPVEIHATFQHPCPQAPHDHPQICICVQDAGPGIPPSDIPLLFGKFVRLKRDIGGPVRGTGLGLYISKHLIETMGGHIWVESSGIAGEGSRFYFTLPVPARIALDM